MVARTELRPRRRPGVPRPPARPAVATAWWRRPWILPLALLVLAVLAFVWPHYATLDPATATVEVPAAQPLKYPLLVVHILGGSIALVTLCLQLWPWLRRTRPAVHRIAGRLYVFAGVAPAALTATALLVNLGGPGWIGRIALNTLWILTTAAGWWTARRGAYAAHRRYMLYSFALTLDAFSTRFLQVLLFTVAGTGLDMVVFLETVAWCGWLINLVLVQVWIEWTARRRTRPVRAVRARRPIPGETDAIPSP